VRSLFCIYLYAPAFFFLLLFSFSSIEKKKRNTKTKQNAALLFSWPYALAMAAAVVEYLVESTLLSRWNQSQRSSSPSPPFLVPFSKTATTTAGCLLVLLGEALRKAAMLTAASSFTHDLAWKRVREHRLVTMGVYSWMRHPGYAGFALWAVGTQVLLRNPLCAIAFALVVSQFMRVRMEAEEALLVGFFGVEYERYAKRVRRWWWW